MKAPTFERRLAGVFGIELGSGVARICVPLLMARIIGASAYGLYVACTNLSILIFNIAVSGLPLTAIYYSATRPSRATVRQLLTSAALVTSLAVVVALPAAVYYRAIVFEGAAVSLVVAALGTAVPYALEMTALGVLRGQRRFERAAWFGFLRQLALLASVGALALIGGTGPRAVVAFGSCTVGLAAIASLSALRGTQTSAAGGTTTFKEIGQFSTHVQASTLLTFLNYRSSLFLIAALTTPAAVGIYGAALTIAEGIWLFSHIVSGALVGEVANHTLEASGRALTARASRLVFAASVVTAAIVAALSKFIMGLFGREFAVGWNTLAVLALGACILAPSRVLASHQAGIGSPQSNVRGTLYGLMTNVLLTVALVPLVGLIGAAAANTASYLVVASDRIRTFRAAEGEPIRLRHLLIPYIADLRSVLDVFAIKSSKLSAVAHKEP